MLQRDLQVGADYALATANQDDARFAARVRVTSPPAAGAVQVQVVEPGLWPAYTDPPAVGEILAVRTARLLHPWEAHDDNVDPAEVSKLHREHAARRAREDARTSRRPSGNHDIAETYDEDLGWDPLDDESGVTELTELFAAAAPSEHYPTPDADAMRRLFSGLPRTIRGDLIGAISPQWPAPPAHPATGTHVGAVLARGAHLLMMAARPPWMRAGLPRPEEVFAQQDVDFVRAVVDGVAANGGRLLLPHVPDLPGWAVHRHWQDEPDVLHALRTLGWVRLATPYTSGDRVHGAGCPSLRERRADVDRTTSAWWQVELLARRHLCGVCGGPNLRHGVEVAHLLAASDVWAARGRERIEAWQSATVLRLVAATAQARADVTEPDITLDSLVWEQLAGTAPGVEGWAAYRLCHGFPRADDDASAHELAVQRLNALSALLPATWALDSLPTGASHGAVNTRYRELKRRLWNTVTEVDRLLFQLPDAS